MHCIFAIMKHNYWIIIPLLGLYIGLLSCGKQEKIPSMETLQKKADSILAPRYEQLLRESKDNFDKRRSIELKPQVDSLLHKNTVIPPMPVLRGYDSTILAPPPALIDTAATTDTLN